ncbi:MAG: MFS transporter [Curvibacter sp.]|nr:MFS transporter [Curvibacter sp.]
MSNTNPRAVDIGRTLDDGPFSALQKWVVLLASLAIVMDGLDGQLIGFAIPMMLKDWGLPRSAFAPAVAAGLLGMAIGSASVGAFADRFGRRLAVVGSVLLFGLATCAIGFAPDVPTLALLRFVAGLGIGGALPSATTMTAEFTPARRRTLAVTATIVCYPLGGMIAGLFAGLVLPVLGWKGLFWIGGLFPIAMALLLGLALPESPRYLARHRERWDALTRLLARMGRQVGAGSVFVDAAEQQREQSAGFAAVFSRDHRRDTLALSFAFFMCLLAVYSAFSWLPTMLATEGLPLDIAGSGLTAYNFGGVFGALLCAVAISRHGSRWPLILCCLGGAATAFVLKGVDVKQNTQLLIVGLGLHGLFVNAVQSTMYALCAHVYPTAVRATGTATALAVGRFGAILSAFAGAAVITSGGAGAYLSLLGGAMVLALVGLLLVRRHIPSLAARAAGRAAPLAGKAA